MADLLGPQYLDTMPFDRLAVFAATAFRIGCEDGFKATRRRVRHKIMQAVFPNGLSGADVYAARLRQVYLAGYDLGQKRWNTQLLSRLDAQPTGA